MIPHHLTLRNFLSYREPAELDLRGLHLACISGLNGAGKSTILDGMTWALFGKSRVKSDDDVVNRAAVGSGAAAEVTFTFELEGAIYRVIRRKAPGKTAELEFHVRAPGEDGDSRWQVKTEAKLRETQAEIEKLLRMNYDVFTNASFLLQGKADEFTTKTADKRKEILAEILGVSQWDDYKELATDRRKAAESEAAAVDRHMAEIDAELAREEEYSRELETAEARVLAATAERDRQETLVAAARQNKTLADQQRDILARISAELADSESELMRAESTAVQRRAELAGHQALLQRRAAIEAAFADWQVAEAEFARWQERAEQYTAIGREQHPLELAIARVETQLQQRVEELEKQSERARQAIEQSRLLRAGLEENRARLAECQARAARLAGEQQAWQEAQSRRQQLEYERKLLEHELIQLQARAQQIEALEREREQFEASRQAATSKLDEALSELKTLELRGQELITKSAEREGLTAEKTRLRAEMDKVKASITQLEEETGHDCPLCGQPLTEEHRLTALRQMQAEGKERGDTFRRNQARLEVLQDEITTLQVVLQRQPTIEKTREAQQATVTRLDTRLQDIERQLSAWQDGAELQRIVAIQTTLADRAELDEIVARLGAYTRAADEARSVAQEQKQIENLITRDQTRVEELDRIGRDWEMSGAPALEEAKRRLAERTFAAEERAALAVLAERLVAVGYDFETHAAARRRREALTDASTEHQQLLQAEAAVKPLADALADLDRQRERMVGRVADLRAQREASARLLEELQSGVADLPAAELELSHLRQRVVDANRLAGGARQKVEVLAVRRQDRQNLAAHKTQTAYRVGLLRQLEEACGRKGVQALLIEDALPEIEDYANELLFRLTGGDMRVSFPTTKVGKSKPDSTIETLEIIISDNAVDRPYENYSGGEKFRINFAIRLALSQMLARRAGARLRTLVIDEGFGSQDPEGRQRLVEAINAVVDEFACILVITHIDELRDKFPARIDVEKTLTGSRLSVVAM
jgi:exonuclease SbcC